MVDEYAFLTAAETPSRLWTSLTHGLPPAESCVPDRSVDHMEFHILHGLRQKQALEQYH